MSAQSPLRVAFFEPMGNLYGSERSAIDLMRSLPRDRVETIAYVPAQAPMIPELTRFGIAVAPFFETNLHLKGRVKRIGAFLRFLRFLRAERIQLVHVNQFGGLPYALLAGRVLGLPVILHSRWHEDPESIASLGRTTELTAIVAISEYQRELLTPAVPDNVPVHVIRNPYELTVMRPPDVSRAAHFILPARLHPHKRQDLLVEAAAIFTKRTGPLRLSFFGREEQGQGYESGLRASVERLDLTPSVEFSGYNPAWIDQSAQATAMVLPSDWESLGRVVFEAWDGGTVPIAWHGSGGPAETISASGGGILYAEQTAESLADAMVAASELSASRRAELVNRGREWVGQHCAPDVHAARVLDVWSKAVAN